MKNVIMENKKGFKETKIGWIPEDWEVVNLDKVGSFRKGKGISKSEIRKEGFQCVRYGELYTYYDNTFKETISFIDLKSSQKSKLLLQGDVLITCSGEDRYEIGKALAFVGKKKTFAGGDLAIYNSLKFNSPYLAAFLNSSKAIRQKIALAQGHSVVHIYSSQISEMFIPKPPLLEQKAIANCLSTWDSFITNLKKIIKAKQKLKKAIMQQLLSGKKRLPGFSEEWQEKRLDFFFDERSERNNKGYQLLSIGEAGVYPQDNSNKKDTSNKDKSKYKKICVDDIGYNTMRMWQGRSALSSLEGIVSPAYTIVKPKENADSQFFAYLFKDPAVIHRFYRNSQGMVSDTLNCKFKDFAIIKLMLPTNKEEQTAIAKVLKTADQEINLLTSQRNQLQLQKKGLMQQLLTGKKRLKF